MSGTRQGDRPLSPHLQVYAPQITSMVSITHRATGVALGAGTLMLAWWLIAAASGPDAYAQFQTCVSSIPGRLIMLGFTWAFVFHLMNGIRHLFWDAGRGLEMSAATKSGWVVIVGSVVLTGLIWVMAYRNLGGMS